MYQSTDVAVITPADMLRAGEMHPEHRAILGFLANRTVNTRMAYELDLKAFATWCEQMGTTMLACDRLLLQMYLEHLQARGLADATVARRFGTARLFLKHAYEEELIAKDPTVRLKQPKVDHERQRRTHFTTLDMAGVLRAANRRANRLDYALLTFMVDTAMRVGEVCALNVEDILRDSGRVQVGFTGKGGRYFRIDLPYPTIEALDKYLKGRDSGPLFLNSAGTRLTRAGVQRIITRNARAAGITQHVTPHGLRRTHAKTLAEHGEDLLGIAESLRHKDARVTRMAYIGNSTHRANQARQRATDIFNNMAG